MTYRDLFMNFLRKLTDEQLDMDVTVYDWEQDEFYPVVDRQITEFNDVLDVDHPYLVINRPIVN